MESYEKRSDEAQSEADRLEEEAERVSRQIDETKSDWQSKQGQVPGLESGDPAESGAEAEEDEEEPDSTSAD